MDVLSTCLFPAASLTWQPRPGAWVLTVVSKATYLLRPGECALALAQEPIADEEHHWGDDPARSLRYPRDLVPVKPGADVLLVGHAFAPGGRPTRALEARLSVGEIDKTIEVVADRWLEPNGVVREGEPFTRMSVGYERAAGGQGTSNPVGVRRDARDANGSITLPNLQRPGSLLGAVEPVGFGPIAPSWPDRRERLGAANAGWSFRDLGQRPLPEGMDLGFFNAAPRDQQPRGLGERVRIALQNLHPEHPQLVCSVPVSAPHAVLEGRREGPHAITLRADTLWIDTDRGICTLTFRGMVPLQSADERGRVLVSTGAEPGAGVPPPPRELQMTADIPLEFRQAGKAALPFAAAAPAPLPAPAIVASPPAVSMLSAPAAVALASPWAVGAGRPVEVLAVAPSIVSAPAPAAEPVPTAVRAEPAPKGASAAPEEALELVWFDPESVPRVRRHASFRPILDALERAPLDADFDDPAFAKDPMLIEDRREVFEVLARAPSTSADELQDTLLRCVRDGGKFVPAISVFAGEMELPFDELAALRATLTTVAPLVGQDEALKSAVQAAKEFLATPGLMSAPAVAEGLTKRIEEAFAQGKRVVPPGYLEAQRERALLEQRQYQRRAVFGGKHLRALVKLGGAQPASATKPSGAQQSGAGGNASGPVPAYLPESLAEALPMYPRFGVRVLAEVRLPADRYESHAAALRVLALARRAPPPKG